METTTAAPSFPLWVIPALPLAGALINLVLGRKAPRWIVSFIAVGTVAAACVASVLAVLQLWDPYSAVMAGGEGGQLPGVVNQLWHWIAIGADQAADGTLTCAPDTRCLIIEMAFRLDTLSAVMILVVTFVGSWIHLYSVGYMAHDPRYSTYFGYLNLFTGAMLILVLGDNLPVMFIGWEGVGLCSYLLIGFWFTEEQNAYAGRKAFIVNRIGDFAFLLGMCLLFWVTGRLDFQGYHSADTIALFETPFIARDHMAAAAGILLFIGAAGKSAQIPLYVWLPDAMAGPTPVSALIHAATMVTAGVYMVARMSWLYMSSTTAMIVVASVGAATALFAALMALAQNDMKKVLAYSTVSQLGFMFVGVGVGAYVAGIFHLVTHAFFKACLFLGAGSVMHAMSGSGDIRIMGGLSRWLPITRWTFLISCLAIAGLPPLSGFFSKDEILASAFTAHHEGWPAWWGMLLYAVLSLAAFCTAFYMFRLYLLVFHGPNRTPADIREHIHESPWTMWVPLVVLAAGACILGLMGLPEIDPLHSVLGRWLPVSLRYEPHHAETGTVLALMGAAVVVAAAGIGLAVALYRSGPSALMGRFAASGAGGWLYRLIYNKFYIDEAYDWIIVRPFRWIGQAIFIGIDRFVIDMVVVDGSWFVVDVVGRIVRWFQNGQVQRYLVALLVGGALVIVFATRRTVDFTWQPRGPSQIAFHAEVDSGPGAAGTEIAWDFDHDGNTDSNEVDAVHTFTNPGRYEVTLKVTSGPFGREQVVTHEVTVGQPRAAGGGR